MLLVYDPVIVEVGKEPSFVLQPLVLRYLETQQRIWFIVCIAFWQ